MENKFINLKKDYKDFIKKTVLRIKELDIDNELDVNKCILIYNLYQNIYLEIETSSNLNVNDINHIILNYNKEDIDIDILKKFLKIKNQYLIKKIIKSHRWEYFINKLNEDLDLNDIELNKKKTNYLISKGVYRLLNTTIDLFRGCWEIAEFKDNKLKKIEIIEPEHYDFLINYLIDKIK